MGGGGGRLLRQADASDGSLWRDTEETRAPYRVLVGAAVVTATQVANPMSLSLDSGD
jgi:hypothetical protein